MTWIRLEGVEEFCAQIDAAVAYVHSERENVVRKAGEDGIAHAKAFHDYKDRTGQLTETCRLILKSKPGATYATMYWPKQYASFVARGTRPHTITADKAPYLIFEWNGRLVRKIEVHHPGTKDHAFASDAKFVAVVAMQDGMEKMMEQIALILT